jgi:hypothetical protein
LNAEQETVTDTNIQDAGKAGLDVSPT